MIHFQKFGDERFVSMASLRIPICRQQQMCLQPNVVQIAKVREVEQDPGAHNSFFLVQLTPWDRTVKVARMHLFCANKRTTSPQIR
jgi:hypothetical protein